MVREDALFVPVLTTREALTWAGLIEWQTIKVLVVVQVGPRQLSRGLLAS
jgi:hypothetical protein